MAHETAATQEARQTSKGPLIDGSEKNEPSDGLTIGQ
jgi:hypothetical protein